MIRDNRLPLKTIILYELCSYISLTGFIVIYQFARFNARISQQIPYFTYFHPLYLYDIQKMSSLSFTTATS